MKILLLFPATPKTIQPPSTPTLSTTFDNPIFFQYEEPDNWLKYGNPWMVPRPENNYKVSFGGSVQRANNKVLEALLVPMCITVLFWCLCATVVFLVSVCYWCPSGVCVLLWSFWCLCATVVLLVSVCYCGSSGVCVLLWFFWCLCATGVSLFYCGFSGFHAHENFSAACEVQRFLFLSLNLCVLVFLCHYDSIHNIVLCKLNK